MAQGTVSATFSFEGDNFAHAWYFNRFRCDPMDGGLLVTTAFISQPGGTPVVNGFFISSSDLQINKSRSLEYLSAISANAPASSDPDQFALVFSVPPTRIYPVNVFNLARLTDIAEMSLYRYSMHSMLLAAKQAGEKASRKSAVIETDPVPCYPVVMFRSSIVVQFELLKEMFDAVG